MGTLNIFLHGLFAVVEEPYRVVLAVPHVDDHDKYLIQVQGDHDAFRFGRGNYELDGVRRVQASKQNPICFPDDKNPCIGSPGQYTEVYTTAPPAYATFVLPRPKYCYSCRCFDKGKQIEFLGSDAAQITSLQFAQMNILAFDFDDIHDLRFRGLPGFCARYKPGSTEFVNVAIVARGPHSDEPAVSRAFATMMHDLIPGKSIALNVLRMDDPTAVPCRGIPGVDAAAFNAFSSPSDFRPDDCVGLMINNN